MKRSHTQVWGFRRYVLRTEGGSHVRALLRDAGTAGRRDALQQPVRLAMRAFAGLS